MFNNSTKLFFNEILNANHNFQNTNTTHWSRNFTPNFQESDFALFPKHVVDVWKDKKCSRVLSNCLNGSFSYRFLRRHCRPEANFTVETFESCPLLSTAGKIGLGGTLLVVLVLLLTIFYCYQRNKKYVVCIRVQLQLSKYNLCIIDFLRLGANRFEYNLSILSKTALTIGGMPAVRTMVSSVKNLGVPHGQYRFDPGWCTTPLNTFSRVGAHLFDRFNNYYSPGVAPSDQ